MRASRRFRLLLLSAALALLLAAGCAGTSDSEQGSTRDTAAPSEPGLAEAELELDGEGVEVPDLSWGDGADAVDEVEAVGLLPTLTSATDASVVDGRDAGGCEVVNQFPVAGEVVPEGEIVELSLDCRQVDWEDQEGDDWELFDEAYADGFDEGCQALFAESPDGTLYEDETAYESYDCESLAPFDADSASDVPIDVPDDPEAAGHELGLLDGCTALFDQMGVWSLNYGDTSWTSSDCPISGTPRIEDLAKADAPSARCTGSLADGTPVVVKPAYGDVSCDGAIALWSEYTRRAPNEGLGSGGHVDLGDWGCISAPAADSRRLGTCARDDLTAEFSVRRP